MKILFFCLLENWSPSLSEHFAETETLQIQVNLPEVRKHLFQNLFRTS